jgi:DNA-binding LytR/AlgR family response regulator
VAGREGLAVLVVDDELPLREELGFLLGNDDRVASVTAVGSGGEALRQLEQHEFDAIFLDIAMPGLSGLDVARVLARFTSAPPVVFVTAHEEHALEAFEVNAVDYLLKPVRDERVHEAVRRICAARDESAEQPADETIPVELGGVTRFVRRSQVRYVEAHGDYVRLHTDDGSHLIRVPLASLEAQWADAGFVRIHRSLLVAVPHIAEIRVEQGRCSVLVGDEELQVSRRHTAKLRDLLVRRNDPRTTP